MSNKKIIQEMFNEQFNKDNNYQKVLSKVEGVSDIKNKVLKFSLVPVCLILLVLGISFIDFDKINDKDNLNSQIISSIYPFKVSVYAATTDEYYSKENITEANKKTMTESIEIKLAKYNKAMSSAVGIPINFEFKYNNPEIDIDSIKISIDNGVILDWDIDTGKVTDLSISYILTENKTLYFSPEKASIITLIGIKNNEEVEKKEITITQDNEYNFYATLDVPVDNEDVAMLNGKELNAPSYFGGIYTENRETIIYLLEDTKQNRTEICDYFSIDESTVIFRKPNHSYKYLTELQNKISEKMTDRTFDFIVASSVLDDKNIIEVIVLKSTKDSQIAELKKLDTTGTAIKVVYGSPAVLEFQ